jgi:hypothetical protein
VSQQPPETQLEKDRRKAAAGKAIADGIAGRRRPPRGEQEQSLPPILPSQINQAIRLAVRAGFQFFLRRGADGKPRIVAAARPGIKTAMLVAEFDNDAELAMVSPLIHQARNFWSKNV